MSSDYEYDVLEIAGSGEIAKVIAGETLGNRVLVYLNADGRYYIADASVTATMPAVGITMHACATGFPVTLLLRGYIGDVSTPWAWTTGSALFTSDTAGAMAHAVGTIAQQVGVAISATQIWFSPQPIGAGASGCAILAGSTAFVGFDECKEPLTNYFYCDGTADDVQIQVAIDYVQALGGGLVNLENGVYDIAATINITDDDISIKGMGANTHLIMSANVHCFNIPGVVGTHIERVFIRDLRITGTEAGVARGIFGDYVDHSEFSFLSIYDMGDSGIRVDNGWGNFINNNTIEDNGAHGVICFGVESHYNIIAENYINGSGSNGILVGASSNIIVDNQVSYSGQYGINSGGPDVVVNGNRLMYNGDGGILVPGYALVVGNVLNHNLGHAITITDWRTTITGNQINHSEASNLSGIYLNGADECCVTGNTINEINPGYANGDGILINDSNFNTIIGNGSVEHTRDGIRLTGDSNNNIISGNTCTENAGYGINIVDGTCDDNRIGRNELLGNTTAPFNDAGTDTILPSKPFQFTDVTGGSAVVQLTSPVGCYVSDANGTAIVWGQLPAEVQQVVRLKVWAVAKDAPVNAGGQMHAEFTFNAGASNANYATAGKSWNVVNKDSEEADYVADDVIHWVLTDADTGDSEISALAAGDSFELLAIYEDADDPDGDTDAKFRVVEVEYV